VVEGVDPTKHILNGAMVHEASTHGVLDPGRPCQVRRAALAEQVRRHGEAEIVTRQALGASSNAWR
jgi:hypothetical protein